MKTFLKECRWGNLLLLRGDMISTFADIYGEWSEMEVRLFKLLLKPESNVVEVGANLGLHTVPLAKFADRSAVICFEPQRIVFQILSANAALNNLTNVFAYRAGVSDETGVIDIESSDYAQPWNYGSFSLAKGMSTEGAFHGAVTTESVQVVSLDTFQHVKDLPSLDLLKIDAKGHEIQVLRGAENLIARHQPVLFVENNNAQHGDDLIAHIKKIGYAPYWFCSARYQPGNFNRVALQIPGSDINVVCFPPGRDPLSGLQPAERFAEIAAGDVRLATLP